MPDPRRRTARAPARRRRPPPSGPRPVWLLAFPGVQSLDVSGPGEVFAMATRALADAGVRDPGYRVVRRRLEESRQGLKAIAADCGFGSVETLRRAFVRALRVGPREYRSRFQRADAGLRVREDEGRARARREDAR
jgi:hypothetical protein